MQNIPTPSNFRTWLNDMWYEHKEEVLNYTGNNVDYPMEVYILKYKWWLKAIYKLKVKSKQL